MEKRGNKKAQTSFELVLLLAIALTILTITIAISKEQTIDVINQKEQTDAKNSVNDLGSAAQEVYTQGEGAKKQVYIILPSDYDPEKSYVSNNTINIHVSGSDYAVVLDFEVHGSLPGESGAHWIWVISEGNSVRIGNAMLSLDKSSLYVRMDRNSSENDFFTVTSLWDINISVILTQDWLHSEVTIASDPNSFPLEPEEAQIILLEFSAVEDAVGIYHGEIEITGNDGNNSERVTLPITIEVVGYGIGVAPPLTITPSLWEIGIMPGINTTKEFTVCTNGGTTLSSVTFTTTSGSPGLWVHNLEPLPAMEPDSCLPKTFTLSVPDNTYSGVYVGAITATGEGAIGAQDTVALLITVGGNLTDVEGPLVSNVVRIPTRAFLGDPVTILATCDDSERGNSTIKKGEIQVDDELWTTMLASDGIYNSPAENVTYTIYDLEFGAHTITIRCVDSRDNVGPEYTSDFNIMKEILFITKDMGASGPEQNWINWLNTHSSDESFAWNKDIMRRDAVVEGSSEINMYAIAVLAEEEITQGSVGTQLATVLVNFMDDGGTVLILDEGFDGPLIKLGIASDTYYHTLTRTIVMDNTNYITEDLLLGSYSIYTTASKIYHVRNDYIGNVLAIDYNQSAHLTHAQLGYGNHFVIWGASLPYRFTTNGNYITTRVFDYSIMQSTVGG